jgi:hypothetical protein
MLVIHKERLTVLPFAYRRVDGTPIGIEDFIITGAVRRRRDDTEPVLAFSSEGENPAIDILDDGETDVGRFNLSLTAAMLTDIVPDNYLLGLSYQTEPDGDKIFFGEAVFELRRAADR